MTAKEIPPEVAIKLCHEIQAENKRKRFSVWKSACHFCLKNAKGDVAKMCLSSEQGCPQVNKQYRFQTGG